MWTTDLIWEIQVLEKTLKDEYKCNSRENKLVGGENLFSRRWKNWWWSLVQGNWRPLNLCFPGDALQPQDILWLWWKFNWLGDVCEPLLWGEFILFFTSCSWISFLPSHWVLFFFPQFPPLSAELLVLFYTPEMSQHSQALQNYVVVC